jgi:plasmid maintenance system antidote protein VapI
MKTKNKLIPKIKFGINYFIQEQMNTTNMTIDSLLVELGISKNEFDKVIQSKDPIPELFADKLSMLFSTSSEYWINIDENYKKWIDNQLI